MRELGYKACYTLSEALPERRARYRQRADTQAIEHMTAFLLFAGGVYP